MDWTGLGQYYSGRLCEDFFRSLPPDALRPLPQDAGWTCCMRVGEWRVEGLGDTVRLANTMHRLAVYAREPDLFQAMKQFIGQITGNDGRPKDKLGLVLAGGGAKGAYQIGVWSALDQLGLSGEIGGISGTSIGAVNALLFARGDFNYAKNLWLELSRTNKRQEIQARIRKVNVKKVPGLGELILDDRFLSQAALKRAASQAVGGGYGDQIRRRYHMYTTSVVAEPLLKLMTMRTKDMKERYIPWGILSPAEMVQAVLASSALPVVYQPVKLRGAEYYDGGLKDNVPFLPLYRCGYRKFIIVHLGRSHVEETQHKLAQCPGAWAVQIIPGPQVGSGVQAMLDLSYKATLHRKKAGELDTLALKDSLLALARG